MSRGIRHGSFLGWGCRAPRRGKRSLKERGGATTQSEGGVIMSATKMRGCSRRQLLSLLGGSIAFPYVLGSGASRAAGLGGKITMIKGPHSADEAKFEAEIIADFKKTNPNVDVEFTTYDWANMNAQLTAGFASGSPARCPVSRRSHLSGLRRARRPAGYDGLGERSRVEVGARRHRAVRVASRQILQGDLGRAGARRRLQHLRQSRSPERSGGRRTPGTSPTPT